MNQNLPYIQLSTLLTGITDVPATDDLSVHGLAIDSRNISTGDLFIALPGTRQHGNDFIEAAVRQGAAAVVYDADSSLPESIKSRLTKDLPLIKIKNITQQAGVIASRFYGEPSRAMTVTGITGTNGKTTCSLLLAQSLDHLGARAGVIGTLGAGLWGELLPSSHTTPDALTLQRQMSELRDLAADQLLMEVSSHGLQQGRESGTEFDAAVFTNLSQDHLDYHGSMQQYAAAKAKLFYQNDLKLAVINSDDEFGRELLAGPVKAKQIISYGIDSGDVCATHILLHEAGIKLDINSPWGALHIDSSLMGRFNVYNLLACTAVLLAAGYRPHEVARGLSLAESAAGRMECIHCRGVTAVIDFAHTPDALQQVLIALREHNQARRLICVFGCGGDRDKAKRPLMGRIAEQFADTVIITDDNPRHEDPAKIRAGIIAGMSASMHQTRQEIPDRRQAITAAWQLAQQGDIILIAGKGHETSQQIGDLIIPFNDREVIAALLSGSAAAEEQE
ncbi:MAG: UDP-N-acetylmuramoyl-L-alanyl-D-glutamate--2,6-diaminopimelate ligase [Pseudomonadota bacterium]|nr:UDP-N-acetylmuramoyl-L-alanyl-D-glutamate--2,6-diaminopimelate ligase [Pseudomonadota bacterium]